MHDRAEIKAAVEAYEAEQHVDAKNRKSLRTIADEHGISKSTLHHRVYDHLSPHKIAHTGSQALTPCKEAEVVCWVGRMARIGLPPARADIQELAKVILEKRQSLEPTRDLNIDPLGINWVDKLCSRHPELAAVWSKCVDRSRIEGTTPEKVQPYFNKLKALFDSRHYEACDVYNMDETGFIQGRMQSSRVYMVVRDEGESLLGRRRRRMAGNAPKKSTRQEWATAIECISANGCALPPMLILKGAGAFASTWRPVEERTDGWELRTSNQGWSSNFLAYEWLSKIFGPSTIPYPDASQRRLLVLDGHGSHVTARFIQYCMANSIDLVILPSHTSHATQPLDLAVFAPLKTAVAAEGERTCRRVPGRLSKQHFVEGLVRARRIALSERNIRSGFRAAGLWPFDPSVVLDQLTPKTPPPQHSQLPREPLASLSSENIEFQSRYCDVVTTPVKNRLDHLSQRLEQATTANTLLQRENEDLKNALNPPKPPRKGMTVANNETHVLSRQNVLDRATTIESSRKVKKRRNNAETRQSGSPALPVASLLG